MAYQSVPTTADYLADLRKNRPTRPAGMRPLPWLQHTRSAPAPEQTVELSVAPATAIESKTSLTALPKVKDDSADIVPAPLFHRRTQSDMPLVSSTASRTSAGRPLVRDASQSTYSIRGRKVSPTAVVQPPSTTPGPGEYRESGARWIEKQEAISIRDALMEMDQLGDEQRVHEAAKNEAADLVWRHQNPRAAQEEKTAAFKNPDLSNFKFKQHLEKGAHARSQSQTYGELAKRMPRSATATRSASDSSASSNEGRTQSDAQPPNASSMSSRRKSGARIISSGSTKGLFRNPEDEIFEDPVQVQTNTNSPHVRFQLDKSSEEKSASPKGSRPLPPASNSFRKRFNPFEIHKNPPTQSRNAGYTQNNDKPLPAIQVEGDDTSLKDGKEIRSDDIRAATSMKRRDRSPNLPTPSAVSDKPGRPIVSFDPSWQPAQRAVKDIHMPREERSGSYNRANSIPTMTVSDTTVPSINISEEKPTVTPVPNIVFPDDTNEPSNPRTVPTISLPGDDVPADIPSISISGDAPPSSSKPQSSSSSRPLPDPSSASKAPRRPRVPWLNRDAPPISRAGVPTATCATCFLPIAGRVVTASGSNSQTAQKARFHPECFTCFHCNTSLEAAEFYPEPENKRIERLEKEGLHEEDEGAELRFYCHLDFHEFFSPRCKNCRTPIEGEVIIAAGAEWHVGHFFCAECGDVSSSSFFLLPPPRKNSHKPTPKLTIISNQHSPSLPQRPSSKKTPTPGASPATHAAPPPAVDPANSPSSTKSPSPRSAAPGTQNVSHVSNVEAVLKRTVVHFLSERLRSS